MMQLAFLQTARVQVTPVNLPQASGARGQPPATLLFEDLNTNATPHASHFPSCKITTWLQTIQVNS